MSDWRMSTREIQRVWNRGSQLTGDPGGNAVLAQTCSEASLQRGMGWQGVQGPSSDRLQVAWGGGTDCHTSLQCTLLLC